MIFRNTPTNSFITLVIHMPFSNKFGQIPEQPAMSLIVTIITTSEKAPFVSQA